MPLQTCFVFRPRKIPGSAWVFPPFPGRLFLGLGEPYNLGNESRTFAFRFKRKKARRAADRKERWKKKLFFVHARLPKGIGEAHAPLHRRVICHSDCRNFYSQPLNSTCMLLQTNGSHSKYVPESIAGLIFFSLKHLRPMRFAVLLLRPLRAVPCSRRRPPSRSKPTPL